MIDLEFPGGFKAHAPWHMNYYGGAVGQVKLLYADLNEFLVLYNGRVGTSGFARSFPGDIYTFALEGEHVAQQEDALEVERVSSSAFASASDASKVVSILSKGKRRIFSNLPPQGSVLLIYGRGRTSSTAVLAGALPSLLSLDFTSCWQTVSAYVRSLYRNDVMLVVEEMLEWRSADEDSTTRPPTALADDPLRPMFGSAVADAVAAGRAAEKAEKAAEKAAALIKANEKKQDDDASPNEPAEEEQEGKVFKAEENATPDNDLDVLEQIIRQTQEELETNNQQNKQKLKQKQEL
eukprot:GHVT01020281.1.p1 GENE.GHVT01020281.1~~GHVT01020281.1.p1  ORF type:complete len:294 (+),score=68.32 GHVT01020281.1:228-1109(+)